MIEPLHLHGLLGAGWSHLAFEPFRAGVAIHRLYHVESGPAAALLRYDPGASVPLHEHTGFEHVLVLSGEQSDEHATLGVGDVAINPPGSRHSVRSATGCTVLLIWERPVRFIEG